MIPQREAYYKYIGKPLNFGIALWTFPCNMFTPWFSHVEKGFFVNGDLNKDEKLVLNYNQQADRQWWYFSSTMRDNAKGCRWIREKDMLKHPERWNVYDVTKPERSSYDMIGDANKLVGSPYDINGVFGFILPIKKINDEDKWYCSEVLWKISAGIWKWLISPRKYFRLRKKKCGLEKLSNG